MLNSIKTLKRHCKANLNMYFNKKNLMMTKNFMYMIDFVSNQNFTIEHKVSKCFWKIFSRYLKFPPGQIAGF